MQDPTAMPIMLKATLSDRTLSATRTATASHNIIEPPMCVQHFHLRECQLIRTNGQIDSVLDVLMNLTLMLSRRLEVA